MEPAAHEAATEEELDDEGSRNEIRDTETILRIIGNNMPDNYQGPQDGFSQAVLSIARDRIILDEGIEVIKDYLAKVPPTARAKGLGSSMSAAAARRAASLAAPSSQASATNVNELQAKDQLDKVL